MYARVFSYQVLPGTMAARLTYGQELLPYTRRQPGFRGLLLMVDHETGANLAIQLWESQAALQASAEDPDYAPRLPHQPDLGFAAEPVSIETYEVAAQETKTAGGARAARVVSYEVQPGRMDDLLRHLEQTTRPAARQHEGWTGVVVLADRAANRVIVVALWAGDEHRTAAEGSTSFTGPLPHQDYAAGDVRVTHFRVEHDEAQTA